jgi:hypothetical protein
MKKLIVAGILSLTALSAQANVVNLTCDLTIETGKQKSIPVELHLDSKAMYAIVDGRQASIGNFGDFYTVDTAGNGYHFRIDRSSLEISQGLSFFEGFGLVPDNFVGKCQVTQTNNKI